jgi:hypothetical protein
MVGTERWGKQCEVDQTPQARARALRAEYAEKYPDKSFPVPSIDKEPEEDSHRVDLEIVEFMKRLEAIKHPPVPPAPIETGIADVTDGLQRMPSA